MSKAFVDRILERLPDAKSNPRGWMARCPAHDDRAASLSIGVGRDGRILLRCFAGCPFDAVVRALGLSFLDMFPSSLRSRELRRRVDREYPTTAIVCAALKKEATLFRRQRRLSDHDRLLARELQDIRARVARELDLTLPAVPQSPYDGPYAGFERDELWPLVLDHAWTTVWIERIGEPPLYPLSKAYLHRLGVALFVAAEDRAGEMMLQIYRAARGAHA